MIAINFPRVRDSGRDSVPFRISRLRTFLRKVRHTAPSMIQGGAQERHYRQRSAATSSVARASTQRAPCPLLSFFQNGARVLR